MRRKPLRQRVTKMILKSPVGKNTFYIIVEAYSKCKTYMYSTCHSVLSLLHELKFCEH